MMFQQTQKIDQLLARAEYGLVIALTAGIAVIMMAQVVMRYFFSAPIFWAEEVAVQLLVFATLLGLSLLVQRGQLVSIDFLPRALSPRVCQGLQVALGLMMLALLIFMSKLGWEWVSRPDVRMELGATTQLPRWYNYSVFPLAFAMMSWHQLAAVLRALTALISGADR